MIAAPTLFQGDMVHCRHVLVVLASMVCSVSAFSTGFPLRRSHLAQRVTRTTLAMNLNQKPFAATIVVALGLMGGLNAPSLAHADPTSAVEDRGANDKANTYIRKGGASTLQQGIVKTITRGVNLDGIDFGGQNLKGVAFQQSIVRQANFKGANLYSASFFDATLDNSDFEDAGGSLFVVPVCVSVTCF